LQSALISYFPNHSAPTIPDRQAPFIDAMIHRISFQPDDCDGELSVMPHIDAIPLCDIIRIKEESSEVGLRDDLRPGNTSGDGPLLTWLINRFEDTPTVADVGPKTNKRVIALVCGCGEWGCSHTSVDIEVTDCRVIWSNLRTWISKYQPYPNFGPWIFERAQYEAECERVARIIEPQHEPILATRLRLLEYRHISVSPETPRTSMEAIIHPDYMEIGCQGQLSTRDQRIDLLLTPLDPGLTHQPYRSINDFSVRLITATLALTSYTLSIPSPDFRSRTYSRRSSLWVLDADRWRLMFHQSTPLPSSPTPSLSESEARESESATDTPSL
jgi:hypothetical protein